MAVPISRFIQHDLGELLYAAQTRVLLGASTQGKETQSAQCQGDFCNLHYFPLNENKGLMKPLFIFIWLTGSYQKEYFTPTR